MTTEEFSNEFDVLLNSYANTLDFGSPPKILELDEYEKSVYLTLAQEQLVKDYYRGGSSYSFELSEELRRSLEALVETKILLKYLKDDILPISKNSYIYELPEDVWFITYEKVEYDTLQPCQKSISPLILPVTLDEFHNINANPFKLASNKRVLRLDIAKNKVELVSLHPIQQYIIRYIKQPSPIILTNLPNNLSINKIYKEKTDCKLNSLLHRNILEIAVLLAYRSRANAK